jgi:hypothetical protein
MLRRAVVFLLGLLVAVPALAETPEEAVAYVFLGLSDGGRLVRGPTTMSWTESSPSPAVFVSEAIVKGQPATITFTVTAINPCDYQIVLEGPPAIVSGKKRLFGMVSLKDVSDISVDADGFHASVVGTGYCETGRTNPSCVPMDRYDLFGPIDAVRQKASLAFLRDTVCIKK